MHYDHYDALFLVAIACALCLKTRHHTTTPQPFYGPFPGPPG